jgi:hypothetical protein
VPFRCSNRAKQQSSVASVLSSGVVTPASKRGGRLRSVQVKPGGALERFGPRLRLRGHDAVRALARGAPKRLARRGAAELGFPVAWLKYLGPTLSGSTLTWAA